MTISGEPVVMSQAAGRFERRVGRMASRSGSLGVERRRRPATSDKGRHGSGGTIERVRRKRIASDGSRVPRLAPCAAGCSQSVSGSRSRTRRSSRSRCPRSSGSSTWRSRRSRGCSRRSISCSRSSPCRPRTSRGGGRARRSPRASSSSPRRRSACGLAPSFDVLVGARCVQALGAALARHVRARSPLAARRGDERALRVWVAAGVLGAALGPAAGGILTQLLGWESIFLAQVPLALVLLLAARGVEAPPDPAPAGRPSVPRTPRSSSSPAGSWRRSSSSCCSSSTAGACRRPRPGSS